MKKKPNILLILTDQQSAHMLSCSGTKWINTPNIDKLASRGVRFTRAYCGNPVCVPSRFSIFTGQLPETIGLRSNSHKNLSPWSKDILKNGMGNIFKQGGYKCVYAGKQHFPGYKAEDLGFDVLTYNQRDILANECCEFLNEEHKKPWLMVASFINPHDICYKGIIDWQDDTNAPSNKDNIEYRTMSKYNKIPKGMSEEYFYSNICPEAPENISPQLNEPQIIQDWLDQRPFKRHIADTYSIKDWRMHRYIYKKLTELMDFKVGKVLDALENSDYKDNTIIVFTSDHGDMDGSHRLEHKTVLYEEAIKIPLIISYNKEIDKGIETDIICSNALDLYPTLLECAGLDVPSSLKGTNILKAMKDKKRERLFVPIESEIGRCIVTKDYKYVMYEYGDNKEQLYDYRKDSLETNNHINKIENQETLKKLRCLFNEQWDEITRIKNISPLLKGIL